jgi:hypothetical protein
VAPSEDGAQATIVVPGLQIGSDPQAVLLGGAEIYATFSRAAVTPFVPVPAIHPFTALPAAPATFFSRPPAPAVAPPPSLISPAARYAVTTITSGDAALVAVAVAAGAMILILFVRWSQRWAWGAALARTQPLKGIDWLYRAFVKT